MRGIATSHFVWGDCTTSPFPEAGEIAALSKESALRVFVLAVSADGCLHPESEHPCEDADTEFAEATQQVRELIH